MPPPGLCTEFLSRALWPGASHTGPCHAFCTEWEGWTPFPEFLPAPGHQGHTASIYFMPVRGFQSWAQPRQRLQAWGSLPSQSVSFLQTSHLPALIFSIQGPLMALKMNVQCSCGATWALQASALRPRRLRALCFQSLLLPGCLESSTPARQLPGPFPSPPPPHPRLPFASEMQLLGPCGGEPTDRTSPCLVSLPWVKLNLSHLCERTLVAPSLCLNEPPLWEKKIFLIK